jgi:hypothetical protein
MSLKSPTLLQINLFYLLKPGVGLELIMSIQLVPWADLQDLEDIISRLKGSSPKIDSNLRLIYDLPKLYTIY